jgi:hypothetical protein
MVCIGENFVEDGEWVIVDGIAAFFMSLAEIVF